MNVRCYRCGWSFSLNRETIADALASVRTTGGRHYAEHCPHCRQMVKIPVEQLRRALPPSWTEAPAEAKPAEAEPAPAPQTKPARPAEKARSKKPARKPRASRRSSARPKK